MREWQVGDPIGDGNDIGVPDTKYMGYLKDDEEEKKDETLEDFRFCMENSMSSFKAGNYENAFYFIKKASDNYRSMNRYQKSQLSDNPFHYNFIIELLCIIYDRHDENESAAAQLIERHSLPFIVCKNCNRIYPNYYGKCWVCENSFTDETYDNSLARQIRDILKYKVYDKPAIERLVQRSLILMKSNDSRLVGIDEIDFMNIDFIFEKEHEYFKTTYTCLFSQEYHEMRIFEDFEVTHDHTKLLEDERFQKAIRDTEMKTGFKFKECDGGYGYKLDKNRYDFIFTDDVNVIARFDIDRTHFAVFDVDLDNMELSKDHRDYERNIF